MPPQKIHLVLDHTFSVPAESIFDAWIDPAAVSIWQPESLRLSGYDSSFRSFTNDPRVGGGFVSLYNRRGEDVRHWGQYVELIRPTRIVTTWLNDEADILDPSTVTFEITPTPAGCHLKLTHELDPRWLSFLERMRLSWLHVFTALETYATSQIASLQSVVGSHP